MKFNKSSGQASRLLLVLAIIVLVAVIIVFLFMRMAEKPLAPVAGTTATPTIPLPVYEQTLGNIRFIFMSAIDRGNVLKASQTTNKTSGVKDLIISNQGAKFIQVTIGAQNMGKENTPQGAWGIGNIVDSQGRNFVLSGGNVNPWLPLPNLCGALLKPAFAPSPCTRIYEVSKESTGLKIIVWIKNGSKINSFLIDLIVK